MAPGFGGVVTVMLEVKNTERVKLEAYLLWFCCCVYSGHFIFNCFALLLYYSRDVSHVASTYDTVKPMDFYLDMILWCFQTGPSI